MSMNSRGSLYKHKLLCKLGRHEYDPGTPRVVNEGYYDEERWVEYKCKYCGSIMTENEDQDFEYRKNRFEHMQASVNRMFYEAVFSFVVMLIFIYLVLG